MKITRILFSRMFLLLFDSAVSVVDLERFALNDRFQMAFSYNLTDGGQASPSLRSTAKPKEMTSSIMADWRIAEC